MLFTGLRIHMIRSHVLQRLEKTFYGDVAAIHFIQQRYDPALEEFRKENSFDDSPLSSPCVHQSEHPPPLLAAATLTLM